MRARRAEHSGADGAAREDEVRGLAGERATDEAHDEPFRDVGCQGLGARADDHALLGPQLRHRSS
jgi:hypothetical protein